MTMAAIQRACPLFALTGIARSVSWHRDKLGFRVERDGEYGIALSYAGRILKAEQDRKSDQ